MVQAVFAWYSLVHPKPESPAALRIIWYCLVQTNTACDALRGLGKDEVDEYGQEYTYNDISWLCYFLYLV